MVEGIEIDGGVRCTGDECRHTREWSSHHQRRCQLNLQRLLAARTEQESRPLGHLAVAFAVQVEVPCLGLGRQVAASRCHCFLAKTVPAVGRGRTGMPLRLSGCPKDAQ
jgi:hypothetical protein